MERGQGERILGSRGKLSAPLDQRDGAVIAVESGLTLGGFQERQVMMTMTPQRPRPVG